MKILINASNIVKGGALQVAHSFINQLKNNTKHSFYIVLSEPLAQLINKQEFLSNFFFYNYTIKPSFFGGITGKENYLNALEENIKPDRVFSIFGPTYWKPKKNHIAGFAKPQYIYYDSPFFKQISKFDLLKLGIKKRIHLHNFNKFCQKIITESEDVTNKVKLLFPEKNIYTVTNYYNQIFDRKKEWDYSIKLPLFNGITLLTITANYPHKNLKIIPEVIDYLSKFHPNFQYRFVLTISKGEIKIQNDEIKKKIIFLGPVNINQCPFLYEQSDFMFLPTLLECFSASYPEAMFMKRPILTSNLSFAKGLCGNAAEYFDPISPKDIANKIVALTFDKNKQIRLVKSGIERLRQFNNAKERAEKYLKIIEES